MQDLQLAIAIARVYEGDNGPVLRELLEDRVLPLAAFEGNRWLAMWAFWMLGRRDMAVRSLIVGNLYGISLHDVNSVTRHLFTRCWISQRTLAKKLDHTWRLTRLSWCSTSSSETCRFRHLKEH